MNKTCTEKCNIIYIFMLMNLITLFDYHICKQKPTAYKIYAPSNSSTMHLYPVFDEKKYCYIVNLPREKNLTMLFYTNYSTFHGLYL